ncbi:MAG: hypothetical protein KC474_11060 [Cyanobacteria bacterium HKST-UBA04]|nr:hypothetical protein [Cyanobacteria bacterium HKST-UBA04]
MTDAAKPVKPIVAVLKTLLIVLAAVVLVLAVLLGGLWWYWEQNKHQVAEVIGREMPDLMIPLVGWEVQGHRTAFLLDQQSDLLVVMIRPNPEKHDASIGPAAQTVRLLKARLKQFVNTTPLDPSVASYFRDAVVQGQTLPVFFGETPMPTIKAHPANGFEAAVGQYQFPGDSQALYFITIDPIDELKGSQIRLFLETLSRAERLPGKAVLSNPPQVTSQTTPQPQP